VDAGIGSTIGCGNSYLGDIVGLKCEWLSSTSTMNEKYVEFIKEMTHYSNALRFCVEMSSLSLSPSLVVLDHLTQCFSRAH
jgi:hypothetical protein